MRWLALFVLIFSLTFLTACDSDSSSGDTSDTSASDTSASDNASCTAFEGACATVNDNAVVLCSTGYEGEGFSVWSESVCTGEDEVWYAEGCPTETALGHCEAAVAGCGEGFTELTYCYQGEGSSTPAEAIAGCEGRCTLGGLGTFVTY